VVEELGTRAWQAALSLVGTRFRLHGRDPAYGLDCVGLVAVAYAAAGHAVCDVPGRYRLSGPALGVAQDWLTACGAAPAEGALRAGDIALLNMGEAGQPQLHLALLGPTGAVHAHAGLRRVVLSPVISAGTLLSRWRLQSGE
jgi:cell wall-associated NlpC family hydrolase